MKRLFQIAIDLNISVERLILDLQKISEKTFNRNTKLNDDEISFLNELHIKNKELKTELEKRKKTFGYDIDENFIFTDKEIEEFTDLYGHYSQLIKEITELINKENKYWALDNSEINALLKLKYKMVSEIQKEMENERCINNKSVNNYLDDSFKWGGLSGEEAHIGFSNTD